MVPRYGRIIKIPALVGLTSLIGTFGELPLSLGNYFWFKDNIKCLNMWAENLKEAVTRFLPDEMVEVILYEHTPFLSNYTDRWAIVIDSRIPQSWRYDALCFTSGKSPPVYMVKEMYDFLGDESYEFEQFIDPLSYHEKRGEKWSSKGMVMKTISVKPRKLDGEWKVELSIK